MTWYSQISKIFPLHKAILHTRSTYDCFLCAEQEDVLLETRIEYIIIANIILQPSIPPSLPSQGKGTAGRKHEESSTFPAVNCTHALVQHCSLLSQQGQRVRYTRCFLYNFSNNFIKSPNDVNSLPIRAKVSAVFHMGNILFFVM